MRQRMVLLLAAIIVGIMVTYSRNEEYHAENVQERIAEEVLRFHVLANSDSAKDQELKLKVKDAVVDYLAPYLEKDEMTLEEAKAEVTRRKEEVLEVARMVIAGEGYDYPVTAELTKDYFPVKVYGDVTLPAGEYEAFRIRIGDAEGKNWWCILYPPLCFVDVTYGYVPEGSKKQLKNVLDKDCYDAVMGGGKVEVRSRFLDWFRELL